MKVVRPMFFLDFTSITHVHRQLYRSEATASCDFLRSKGDLLPQSLMDVSNIAILISATYTVGYAF
jgi:hypothetical protein